MLMCVVFGALFIATGIVFFSGRAEYWIRALREMPAEEKARIRIRPLLQNLSVAFFLAGVLFLLAGYSEGFREQGFRWAMLIWFALCIMDVLYIGKSKRYLVDRA